MKALSRMLIVLASIVVATTIVTAQDVMVPFDVETKVVTYNATMEKQLGLFPDVAELVEARIWMSPDSVYTLEISSGMGDRFVRSRRTLTREQVLDIQTRFTSARRSRLQTIGLDQSGRPTVLWTTTLLGTAYYGTAFGLVAFGNSFGESQVTSALPYLFAGSAGYLIPYLLTKNATVTHGDAVLMQNALVQGIGIGWGLTSVILGDKIVDGDNYRVGFGLSILTGIGGTVAAYKFSRSHNLAVGHADVIGTSSLFGGLTGLMTAFTVLGSTDFTGSEWVRIIPASALVGSAAGVLLGHAAAKAQPYSAGDADVYRLSGLIGAALPASIAAAASSTGDPEIVTALTAVTTVAGLYVGDRLVLGKDYSAEEGNYISLGTVGGALIGLGLAVMADASEYFPLMVLGGGAAGFALTQNSFSGDARTRARSMGSLDLDWHLNPSAPFMAKAMQGVSVPFIGLSGRF